MRENHLKSILCLSACLGALFLSDSAEAARLASHGARPEPPTLLHSKANSFQSAAAEVCTVDPAKELFITNVSVVDDCYRTTWTGECSDTALPATRGAWTFGRIAEGVFGTNDPKKLSNRVRQWLNLWMEPQVVNTDVVQPRPAVRDLIIRPWEAASGGKVLDMKKAPFRFLAAVVRMDIGDPIDMPPLRSAGEFRLVYNVLDQAGNPTPFTIILEYNIAVDECQDILDYAHAFNKLSSLEFGPEYNAALQALTDRIITRGAGPGRLNGSALIALRTNESFLSTPWELRNFVLARDPGEAGDDGLKNARLVPTIVAPMEKFQGTQTMADVINLSTQDLIDGNLGFPQNFGGEPFLGGAAQNRLDLGWDGPPPACSTIERPIGRWLFSSFTCQGCHGPETATNFLHVMPRQEGEASQLSAFLTGSEFTDMCGIRFRRNDLRRRTNFQCFLLSLTCPSE